MRYAIYFTPAADASLTRTAARWLGRDAFSGHGVAPAPVAGLAASELAFHTASARRYGFHATLKAPFALAAGATEQGLIAALEAFCAGRAPVVIATLVARQLDGFYALVPRERTAALDALAGDVVTAFDRFRAPLAQAEIARRSPDTLRPAELKNLQQWGYPYVFESFRFHMTLTGRVAGPEATVLGRAIDRHFAEFVGKPLEIAAIALFVEPEPGAPFTVRSFHPFNRVAQRKSA